MQSGHAGRTYIVTKFLLEVQNSPRDLIALSLWGNFVTASDHIGIVTKVLHEVQNSPRDFIALSLWEEFVTASDHIGIFTNFLLDVLLDDQNPLRTSLSLQGKFCDSVKTGSMTSHTAVKVGKGRRCDGQLLLAQVASICTASDWRPGRVWNLLHDQPCVWARHCYGSSRMD